MNDCSNTQCSSSVFDCITVVVAHPFGFDSPPQINLAFDTSCLDCISEVCTIPGSAFNPCNTSEQISGELAVKRLRVVGCIKYIVSITAFGDGRAPDGTIARSHFCAEGTACVDQILCVVPFGNDFSCPNFSNTIGRIVSQTNSVNACSDRVFTVNVRFDLPPCETA